MSTNAALSMASGLAYRNPRAALEWLGAAFGFEVTMVIENADGSIGHSEMQTGGGVVYVGAEWDERHRSPASLDGVNTQSLHVQLASGLDAHCAHARAAGAKILREPADQFYGDRNYVAMDLEGHVWTFGQRVKTMTLDEMAAAGNLVVRNHL